MGLVRGRLHIVGGAKNVAASVVLLFLDDISTLCNAISVSLMSSDSPSKPAAGGEYCWGAVFYYSGFEEESKGDICLGI